eukprot:TRINITY_DN5011_c0_g1_i2.p1 TRINITY_DN5011_c0_g1~~TRINITY_DN5011_c0_g1_i2.p1  ORF type:complete len:748 (+),score=82.97 TRINITY_DN5011_c0_g1_i2:70-2313(+)
MQVRYGLVIAVVYAAFLALNYQADAEPAVGSMNDMKHIVIWMQENRAFDHYYGSLNGVRGFNDRAHPRLANGKPIFYQPVKSAQSYILPFYLAFDKTATQCMPAPEMAYESDINIYNGGKMDSWNMARDPGFGMAYFNRSDLPYYYALADAFTIGDQYFQSTFTATNPNRQHLFTGSNGLSVPGSGYCMLDDTEYTPGFEWETMAETLQKAGITWGVLQEHDNFDDNAFEWFKVFQEAKKGSVWFDQGVQPVPDLVTAFEHLVSTDSLPQVLWIVGPTALSEHAENHPGDGEDLSHRLISVLARPENAAVYAKTAFILNYDEGGQFFDHHWTPTPPRSGNDGQSTITTDGELTLVEQFNIPRGNPIGLGFRVPLILVSPWTRGHYVFSQTSDHTSVIQFIEKRFGVRCPNISPWRRAISSDLTAAFDWNAPDYTWPASFPDTSDNVNKSKWECDHLPNPQLPSKQFMPTQETGIRLSRPLPYEFVVSDSTSVRSDLVSVMINNTGQSGAAFLVVDESNPESSQPRKYAVEAGKWLSDDWELTGAGNVYNLSLYGPNGFVRRFSGSSGSAIIQATVDYVKPSSKVLLNLAINLNVTVTGTCKFVVTDNAYNTGGPWAVSVPVGDSAPQSLAIDVSKSGSWYDFTVAMIPFSGDCPIRAAFSRTFMGRMETGRYTTSDPAMATGKSPFQEPIAYDPVPEQYRTVSKWTMAKQCASRRSRMKDACWDPSLESARRKEQLLLRSAGEQIQM